MRWSEGLSLLFDCNTYVNHQCTPFIVNEMYKVSYRKKNLTKEYTLILQCNILFIRTANALLQKISSGGIALRCQMKARQKWRQIKCFFSFLFFFTCLNASNNIFLITRWFMLYIKKYIYILPSLFLSQSTKSGNKYERKVKCRQQAENTWLNF